jgi:hypothetical protein
MEQPLDGRGRTLIDAVVTPAEEQAGLRNELR